MLWSWKTKREKNQPDLHALLFCCCFTVISNLRCNLDIWKLVKKKRMSILHHHRSEFDRVFLSLLTERDAHEQINWFFSCLFSSLIVCSCKWWSSASEIWRRRWPIRITRPSQNPWKRPHFRSFSAAFQIGCPTCHQETNYHDYSQECRPSEFHYITFQ